MGSTLIPRQFHASLISDLVDKGISITRDFLAVTDTDLLCLFSLFIPNASCCVITVSHTSITRL